MKDESVISVHEPVSMSAALPRILLVNHSCSLSAGTTRSLLLNLKHLHNKYSFIVAAPSDSDGLPSALLDYEIPFYPLRSRFFGPFRSLIDVILQQRCDLVYANDLDSVTRQAFWAAKLTGRPFVWHIREPVTKKRWVWTVRYSDAVVANSQYTAQAISSVAGYRSPVFIPNGVDPMEFGMDRVKARESLLMELGWPSDSFLILNLGWLSPRKNQMDSLELMRLVTEHHSEARLVLVGAPEHAGYAQELWLRIRQSSLSQNVRLLGFRPNPSGYLLGADLLLHTPVYEPQGRVVLEAMAAGLPVVAYSVGGIPEAVIEGETGLLVPAGNVAAAAEAVCRLIADPERRQKMGKAGRDRVVHHFTAEATARLVDDVIQSVLSQHRSNETEGRRQRRSSQRKG